MHLLIAFTICFLHIVTAQACFKDRLSTVTIQNYDGPIYVASPCNLNCEKQCSQLYHINNPNRCDCDCGCVSKNAACGVPLPCSQTACVSLGTPQVPCTQSACMPIGSQQMPCTGCSQGGCVQGTVSLQGTYVQAWQGPGSTPLPAAYYAQSCSENCCRDGWPKISYNDLGSLPCGLNSQCANQICQCGKRSGYY